VKLTDTVPAMLQILDLFNSTNYLGGYRFIGEEGAASGAARTTMTVVREGKTGGDGTDDGSKPSASAFDSYDDEDLTTGRDVNFLLSLDRPTTLGASLQITGESSRFTPEWVGPMLMAMWEEELSGAGGAGGGEVRAQVEGYFVDGTYRPNPKDFFPEELLLQFTLKQK